MVRIVGVLRGVDWQFRRCSVERGKHRCGMAVGVRSVNEWIVTVSQGKHRQLRRVKQWSVEDLCGLVGIGSNGKLRCGAELHGVAALNRDYERRNIHSGLSIKKWEQN